MRYPLLKRGDRGEDVKRVQALLSLYGHLHGDIDGQFGPGTANAAMAFQKRFDLDPDGIVGTKTWNALLTGPVIPDPNSPEETVAPDKPVPTKQYSPAVEAEMDKLWITQAVTDPARFDWYVTRSMANKDRYEAIAERVNPQMPWWFVAVIHGLESGFRFHRHLHNGDSLKKRTWRVPKGRPVKGEPPFTWEESAYDALTMPGKNFDRETDWSIPKILWNLEEYNGLGYRLYREIHTPYLWAGTNHYEKGKYVADGKYDPDAVSSQAGAAGVIKLLV